MLENEEILIRFKNIKVNRDPGKTGGSTGGKRAAKPAVQPQFNAKCIFV